MIDIDTYMTCICPLHIISLHRSNHVSQDIHKIRYTMPSNIRDRINQYTILFYI
jgi:hypothetical protein